MNGRTEIDESLDSAASHCEHIRNLADSEPHRSTSLSCLPALFHGMCSRASSGESSH